MQVSPKSLRIRIIVNVFATSLVAIILIGGLIVSQMRIVTEALAREKLLEQAKRMASFIEYDREGNMFLDMTRRTRDYYADNSSSQFAVLNAGGKVLFRSDNFVRDRIKDTLQEGGKYYFDFMTDEGQRFVGLKYDYLFENKIHPVYVIEEEAEFSKFLTTLENNFLLSILTYSVPLLLLQGLFVLFIFRQTFKPIIKASRDARKIKYDNLSYRLDEKHVPAEILPLIQSINNGLARLEESANSQRLFIASAAHELRTPVSILKARISDLKNEKGVYLLNEDLQNINRLITQMLDISRLDMAEAAPKTKVNLNELAKKACENMGPLFIHEGKELSLEQVEYDQIVYGNEDTLYRAVLNLLENALKHTPGKTAVEVIVEEKKIIVRDYGFPIADENKTRIFERFGKLPESAGTKGSGLGLAIVKKAAEIHNGAIILVTRKNGNDFILDLE
jgi:signal transduction histidine kinase